MTTSELHDRSSPEHRQHTTADRSWMLWAAIGIVDIWVALAMSRLRGSAAWEPIWIGLTVGTFAVWAVATVLAITLPVLETGTDPTRIPFAAFFAPAAAALCTALAGLVANLFRGGTR
jgi:hypothetical protein